MRPSKARTSQRELWLRAERLKTERLKTNSLYKRRCTLATPVIAPMVGKILRAEKKVGERVEEDEVVVVMEAMKMEIPIVAPVTGVLKEIRVSPGQAVEAEDILATIE
jgi:biotin carboxyl carrier protein